MQPTSPGPCEWVGCLVKDRIWHQEAQYTVLAALAMGYKDFIFIHVTIACLDLVAHCPFSAKVWANLSTKV